MKKILFLSIFAILCLYSCNRYDYLINDYRLYGNGDYFSGDEKFTPDAIFYEVKILDMHYIDKNPLNLTCISSGYSHYIAEQKKDVQSTIDKFSFVKIEFQTKNIYVHKKLVEYYLRLKIDTNHMFAISPYPMNYYYLADTTALRNISTIYYPFNGKKIVYDKLKNKLLGNTCLIAIDPHRNLKCYDVAHLNMSEFVADIFPFNHYSKDSLFTYSYMLDIFTNAINAVNHDVNPTIYYENKYYPINYLETSKLRSDSTIIRSTQCNDCEFSQQLIN